MPNTENLNQELNAIHKIAKEDVATLAMPVGAYVQESENLFQWVQPDKEKLEGAGLNLSLIDGLPARGGALREAQSIWMTEKNVQEDAEAEWKEKAPLAYDFRDGLNHTFRYAYRKQSDILKRVADIDEGSSNADMVQDLNDLSVLGKKNPAPLEAAGFDLGELDKASSLSDEMGSLLARAIGDRQEYSEAKITRDKAYTHLKQAVDEIRSCGKYLFWKTPERLKGYSSRYRKNHR